MGFKSDEWELRATGLEQVRWRGQDLILNYAEIAGGTVRVYDVRYHFPDAEVWAATHEKRGYAVHHDAVVLRDEDKNFNGTTLDESLDRLDVVYRYHLNFNGERPGEATWNGIGYHRMIDPSGRVFITGGSGTHRAHAKGWDPVAQATWNQTFIGYCFMGDHSAGSPPEAAMRAFCEVLQWETDRRGVSMILRPHKHLTPDTACPGSWVGVDAWADVTLRPAAVVADVRHYCPCGMVADHEVPGVGWFCPVHYPTPEPVSSTAAALAAVEQAQEALGRAAAALRGG